MWHDGLWVENPYFQKVSVWKAEDEIGQVAWGETRIKGRVCSGWDLGSPGKHGCRNPWEEDQTQHVVPNLHLFSEWEGNSQGPGEGHKAQLTADPHIALAWHGIWRKEKERIFVLLSNSGSPWTVPPCLAPPDSCKELEAWFPLLLSLQNSPCRRELSSQRLAHRHVRISSSRTFQWQSREGPVMK